MHRPTPLTIHEKALRAALSVTLALSACGPKGGGGAETTLTGADGGGVGGDGADGTGADGADGTGADGTGADGTDGTDGTGADGTDGTGADGTDGGSGVSPVDGSCAHHTDTDALFACCTELDLECQAAFPDDWDAWYSCVYGPETGCIPWGPPAPPEMT